MANFLGGILGNDGIAKIAGEKAGDAVEGLVNKCISGQGKKEESKGEAKGFDIGDVLKMGDKKEDGGGGDKGGVMDLVGGGGGLPSALSGFMK